MLDRDTNSTVSRNTVLNGSGWGVYRNQSVSTLADNTVERNLLGNLR